MAVSYNVRQFEELRARLDAAAQARFVPMLARRLGAVAIKLLADEFRESRDPYGNTWKAVFRNRRRDRRARARRLRAGQPLRADKPLIDTGRLRAAAVAQSANQSSGNQVRVVIPVEYASYHQTGTRKMVKRQIVPGPPAGLGFIWGRAMDREARAVMRQALQPGGGGAGGGGAP